MSSNHATADRKTCAHLTETAFNHELSIKQPSNVTTLTFQKHTQVLQRTNSRQHTVHHIASFRHAKHRNSTKLSKHIWILKDSNIDHSISWCIISSRSSYNSSNKRCTGNLCLQEKFLIIYRPNLSSLNKCNKLVSSCCHRNKALLWNNYTFEHLNSPQQ